MNSTAFNELEIVREIYRQAQSTHMGFGQGIGKPNIVFWGNIDVFELLM